MVVISLPSTALTGVTQDLNYSTQVYGEMAYALGAEGGAKPLEFQFGGQYLPVAKSSLRGAPYVASNYHIREDFGFQGGFNTVAKASDISEGAYLAASYSTSACTRGG